MLGAVVQVTKGFRDGMRWSARLIGLYVIGYTLLPAFLFLLSQAATSSGLAAPGPSAGAPIPDDVVGILMLIISGPQALLGIWAAWDLARGHFPRAAAEAGPDA